MNDYKFTKANKLKKSKEYFFLSKYGVRFFGDYLIIIIKKNNLGLNRLGITVSKKVGNAVVRNKIKRIKREFFRIYLNRQLNSYDINLISKKKLGKVSFNHIFIHIKNEFKKIMIDLT